MNQTTAENLMKITEESYQKIAASFSDTRNFSWAEIDLAITKYLKDNVKILDLGCGNGRLLISLKKYLENFDYTGVDSCLELIKKAQLATLSSRASRACLPAGRGSQIISFAHQNILDLQNFSDNSFDTIFMVASFNHIAGQKLQKKILLEINRILKPNGILIMTNWNLWQFHSKKSFWNNLSKKQPTNYGLRVTDYKEIVTLWQNKYPLYYHAFTLRELKKLLQKTDFEVLENYYVKDGKKAHWFNGRNILTATRKV
ncbi:MAG TPA: class I SAM-dependent methyltransferase [bacterium]|nr:class I SAM-dependent methyltransferase [bacterium]